MRAQQKYVYEHRKKNGVSPVECSEVRPSPNLAFAGTEVNEGQLSRSRQIARCARSLDAIGFRLCFWHLFWVSLRQPRVHGPGILNYLISLRPTCLTLTSLKSYSYRIT